MARNALPAVRDAGFESALAAAPGDAGLRAVYCDWLEERRGDGYAAARRWLVRVGKWPLPVWEELLLRLTRPPVFCFGTDRRTDLSGYGPHLLPDPLFRALRRRAARIADHDSWAAAFAALRAGHLPSIANGDWVYFPTAQAAAESLAGQVGD